MFEKFIKWLAEKHISRAAVTGYNLAKQEREDNAKIDLDFELKNAIGKKVIHCPNEWADPTFAIVEGVTSICLSNQPALSCKDVLTEEKTLLLPGSFFYADELQTLSILKLNPFQRWNLSIGRMYHMRNMWSKGYPPKDNLTDKPTLEMKLRKAGFLFRSKETSNFLVDVVSTFEYLVYDFQFSNLDCLVCIKNGRAVYELEFADTNEVKEFKAILTIDSRSSD